jgi:aspartate carbamoyltransferase catalytic subunit
MAYQWPHRHLLDIESLCTEDLRFLLDRAHALEKEAPATGLQTYTNRPLTVANVFFENSTRTRLSFEQAQHRLGLHLLSWSVAGSSAAKGESLKDTIANLLAMSVELMVVRHPDSGALAFLAQVFEGQKVQFVNAGDGTHAHPTQALADMLTLEKQLGDLRDLHIGIVGDVLHSRVARSNIFALKLLGAKVHVCGPATLIPNALKSMVDSTSHDLELLLPKLDGVMALRMQVERQSVAYVGSARDFSLRFGLKNSRLNHLIRPIPVLHPGPVNRGVELDSRVMDGGNALILNQVANGVLVRTAVLETLLRNQ